MPIDEFNAEIIILKCTPPTLSNTTRLPAIFTMLALERPSTISVVDDVKGMDIVDLGYDFWHLRAMVY